MKLHYGNLLEQAKNGEFDVIIHGCNAFHTMGAGIAKYIKQDFPEAFEADKKTAYGDKNKIGTFSEAVVTRNNHTFVVINSYTQFKYGGGVDNFEYDSFPGLLQSIKAKYGDKKIGLPLIGCGLAGGDEIRILKMIKENFEGVDYKLVELDVNRTLKVAKEEDVKKTDYTYFFHLTSPFSNFHPAKFKYKDLAFISNEQFMMYSKAKTFNDEVTAQKILDLNNTPIAKDFIDGKITREQIVNNKDWADEWNKLMMSVKKLGRGVKNYDDLVWSNKREKVVLFGARLKFNQNEDLKQILLNTGNTIMVEASKYDPIWSCGLSEYDAKKVAPSQWPGLNLLGKVLDTVKAELQNNLVDTTQLKKKALDSYSNPIEVVNFYHMGKQIPEDGVYIGRANKNFNLPSSIFANPFPMKDQSEDERTRVILEFKNWLWKQLSEEKFTKKDLLALNGKKLCCYCSPILSSDIDKGYKLSIKDDSTIGLEMTKEEFFGQLDINPLDYIRVVNVRGNKENQAQPDEKLIAAHRANPTLGNPFIMKDKSAAERNRVIEAYKKHLEEDLIAQGPIYKLLNKIADEIIEKKEKIALSCWCAPQACHAHEIAKVLVLMVAEKRLIQVIEAPKVNLKNKP